MARLGTVGRGEQSVSQWVKNDVIEPRGGCWLGWAGLGWAGLSWGAGAGDTSPVSSSSQAAGYAELGTTAAHKYAVKQEATDLNIWTLNQFF